MRCLNPNEVVNPTTKQALTVCCGRCLPCRIRKQSKAVFRIDAERRFSEFKRAYFVTLTYADDFVPHQYIKCDKRTGEILKDIKSDDPILNPDHIINFFKRFRRYSGIKCSYFYVGEYGDTFDRPHWHFILHCNSDWRTVVEYVKHAWSVSASKDDRRKGNFSLSRTYSVMRRSMGRITVSSVTMRRMRYCAKYVVKDNNSNNLVPKFARWSKGYGYNWLFQPEAKYVRRNCLLFAYTSDGKPASLDRYYLSRLYSSGERVQAYLLHLRYQDAVTDLISSDSMPDYLLDKPISEQAAWYHEHDRQEVLQYWRLRIRQFTPLHF